MPKANDSFFSAKIFRKPKRYFSSNRLDLTHSPTFDKNKKSVNNNYKN